MIQEAITKIVELTRQAEQRDKITLQLTGSYDGNAQTYEYSVDPTANGPKLGEALKPFRPAKLQVATLTGFVDAIAAGIAGAPGNPSPAGRIVHVEDYLTVSLKSALCDVYGVRDTFLTAKYAPAGDFKFNEYQSGELFLIGLSTCFLRIDGDDTEYVTKIASNLKAGDTVHSQDDGVNQSVTLKMGQVETVEHTLKNRIKLTPIRTFYEAAPVETEFLLRLKPSGGGLPMIALFPLGGTRWQGESMLSIKSYLGSNLAAGTVILA
jgi:hypothetical protein